MRAVQDTPVKSIFGPHITGDAIDLFGHEILSGSWRPDRPLQLWDLRSTELIKDYAWTNYGESTMLYAAQFSKDTNARHIIAGERSIRKFEEQCFVIESC